MLNKEMNFLRNFGSEQMMNSMSTQAVTQEIVSGDAASEWGIEGMRSQEFSVGIFFFLIICIFVFVAIVFMFMRSGKGQSLKTGEKIMFVWILFGVVVAIAMGVTQLFFGRLL